MLSRIAAVLASTLLCALALAVPAHATFPGKNGKIAFDSNRAGGQGIYAMNPDGSAQTLLVPDSGPFGEYPVWAADGTRFTFSEIALSDIDEEMISIASADGTNVQDVCTGSGCFQCSIIDNICGLEGRVAWSPDGARIAYMVYRGSTYRNAPPGAGQLVIINSDGSNLTWVTHTGFENDRHSPDWSPDGSRIAFNNRHVIGTINPDGTRERLLPDAVSIPGASSRTPSWSPDGSRLAFASNRDDPDPSSQRCSTTIECRYEIYTMNADGSNRTRITNDSAFDVSPVWSPDGTKIAFASRRDGNFDIYSMNADGSGQTQLTTDLADDFHPDWQPLPEPQRSDYKNAASFCKADRDFLEDPAFAHKYGTNGNGANAYGRCVSGK
jgi:Tol biopolymer transport system component